MPPSIDIMGVQSAARDPLFEPPSDWAARPVVDVVTDSWTLSDEEHIVKELQLYGYVVIGLGKTQLADLENHMLDVAKRLGLGSPFVPDLYAGRAIYRDSGMHLIGAFHQKKDAPSAFVSTAAQALHTDGTLQPLGFVNTTMLGCVEQAFEGGASVLFNALGAFWDLWTRDRVAASTLLWDKCLERSASLDPGHPPTSGPAFGCVGDRRFLTRYSRTPGDHYYAPPGKENGLAVALDHLSSLTRSSSGFYREMVLSPGQLLLLANSRLSHGRLAYRDRMTGSSRLFLRALFKNSPPMPQR